MRPDQVCKVGMDRRRFIGSALSATAMGAILGALPSAGAESPTIKENKKLEVDLTGLKA